MPLFAAIAAAASRRLPRLAAADYAAMPLFRRATLCCRYASMMRVLPFFDISVHAAPAYAIIDAYALPPLLPCIDAAP
jgi:hypothetical protein